MSDVMLPRSRSFGKGGISSGTALGTSIRGSAASYRFSRLHISVIAV